MYSIVFSDIDGTLLNSGHVVTPKTKESIHSVMDKGMSFAVVSARSPSGIYPILRKNDFRCPVIAYSGALILDKDGSVLYEKGMPCERAGEVISYIEEQEMPMAWCVYSYDDWMVKDRSDQRVGNEERIVEACAREGTVDSLSEKGDPVHKILCICDEGEILGIEERLRANFGDLNIVKSSDILLEIMHKDVNKATAVKLLCEYLGCDIGDSIAFGDNYNDVEMLEAAGMGVVMGNAPADIRDRFETVTSDNDNDGIAEILNKI